MKWATVEFWFMPALRLTFVMKSICSCCCSDAMQCNRTTEFKCRDTGSCIPLTDHCNGHENCRDGSDELHCGTLPYVFCSYLCWCIALVFIVIIVSGDFGVCFFTYLIFITICSQTVKLADLQQHPRLELSFLYNFIMTGQVIHTVYPCHQAEFGVNWQSVTLCRWDGNRHIGHALQT